MNLILGFEAAQGRGGRQRPLGPNRLRAPSHFPDRRVQIIELLVLDVGGVPDRQPPLLSPIEGHHDLTL